MTGVQTCALPICRPLSDLIELDERTRKELAFEATLTDQQIEMLQELGYLPSPNDNE